MRYFRLVNAESLAYRDPYNGNKERVVHHGEVVRARTDVEADYFGSQTRRFQECTKDGWLFDRPTAIFGHKVRPIAVFKFQRGKEPVPAVDPRLMENNKLRTLQLATERDIAD